MCTFYYVYIFSVCNTEKMCTKKYEFNYINSANKIMTITILRSNDGMSQDLLFVLLPSRPCKGFMWECIQIYFIQI